MHFFTLHLRAIFAGPSRHLRGTFAPSSVAPQSQILEIAGYSSGLLKSVATESAANLGANSVKLFLSEP